MNELIKITTNAQGSQVVSARGLHEFLEVKGDFSTWCKRMFDYGFEEEKDFTSILGKSTGGRPTIDYAPSTEGITCFMRNTKTRDTRRQKLIPLLIRAGKRKPKSKPFGRSAVGRGFTLFLTKN